jgi:hypothetical protein
MRSLLAFVDRRNAENGVSINFAASAAATAQAATDNTVKALFNNDGRLASKRVFTHSGIYANEFGSSSYSQKTIAFTVYDNFGSLNIKFVTDRNTITLQNVPAVVYTRHDGAMTEIARYNEYPERAVSIDIGYTPQGDELVFSVSGNNAGGAACTHMKNISVTRHKRLIP